VSTSTGEAASVFVDGILRGKAPLVVRATAGKHVVSVRGTGSSFGSMSVTVTKRDTVRAVLAPGAGVPKE
jgi:hypothetical protein